VTRRALIWLVAIACRKDAALPPATGPGAPPLPVLPVIHPPAAPPAAPAASSPTATGTLLPHAEVALAARARGAITALDAEVGARVRRGQVVFRVDDRDAALRLAQARTQLAVARQQLAGLEVERDRTERLFAQQAASPQQHDQLASQVAAARLGVTQAHNGVAIASQAVDDTIARAPLDGIVVARHASLGQLVDGPVVTIQDQARLDLAFRLPDRALAHVKVGDPVTVTLPALGLSREAAIAIVAPRVDPRTRTVELTCVLDNRDGALRPGLAAEVTLGRAP